MKKRLADAFHLEAGKDYRVEGEPLDVSGAHALALLDRYQFQWWALSLIGANPRDDKKKKGADAGIDGELTFMEAKGRVKRILVSVKSGKVDVGQVRDLKGAMQGNAELGVFITLEPPTGPMHQEAVKSGYYHSELWHEDYPRVQICTIDDLLAGRRPKLPRSSAGAFTQTQFMGAERAVQGQLLP